MLMDGPFGESAEMKMRYRIFRTLDRPLKSMTVSEICEKAAISRDTFYRYFTSKYDIVMWHGRLVQAIYLDQVGRSIDWKTGYYHDFRLLTEEQDVYGKTLVGLGCPTDEFPEMVLHREETFLRTLAMRGVEVDDDLRYAIKAFVLLETILVSRWLLDGCNPDPETQAQRMVNLIPHRLYNALEGTEKKTR